jgi:hypothetical protein
MSQNASRGPRRVAIERREGLSAEAFAALYPARSEPLILAGRAAGWPAVGRWTLEHIKAKYPAVLVGASVDLPADVVPYWLYHDDHVRDLPLAALVDLIASEERTLACYANQVSFDSMPDLRADVDFSDLTPVTRDPRITTNLWIGSAGTRSGLHYDSSDNFLVQICGKKRLSLVPPGEFREVYPFTWNFSKSPVNPEDPDLATYPRFADATVWEGHLAPGDVLFLPALWWHYVTSLDPSISINQWFGGQKLSDRQWYRRMTEHGPAYWAEFLRQFAVHGVLRREYKRRLFAAPPHGVRKYREMVGFLRATVRRANGRRSPPPGRSPSGA